MRTYLVTGGAGFIGSNYIHYMFKKYGDEIRIINVDALTYAGNLENLKDVEGRDNYTFIRANICDNEAIEKIFAENDIDRVVHFAAESHVDRSIKNPEIFVQTNVLGTAVMLNCAKAAWEKEDGTFQEDKKFLHVSTDEVYGSLENEGEYFYETTPYAPHSPYSASKAGSDMLVKAYMDTYHFPANITNCSNNYGPYQFPEKLIPLIINNALHGKKLPVYGDGKNVRDWLYVEDHAKAIDMVQEKGRLFETYNVGGHNEKQNIEIIHIILDTLREMLPDSDPRKGAYQRGPDHLCGGQKRPRPPLCHRAGQDPCGDRLGAGDHVRGRHQKDHRLVFRARGLDEKRDQRRLPEVLRGNVPYRKINGHAAGNT